MVLLKKLISGALLTSRLKPIEMVEVGIPGKPKEIIVYKGKIYVYNPQGQTLIDGGLITTNGLATQAVTVEKLYTAVKPFIHNITWTADDYNTCSWSSGTIKWGDGSTSSINAGNTGNITETNYIYYNGTSTLQKTTNYQIAIGGTNILLAIVELGDSGGKCIIHVIFSIGTTIDGDTITTGKIESVDGKIYFDLNNRRLILNDGSDNRLLLGYQSGGF